jgi:hypothetical protein
MTLTIPQSATLLYAPSTNVADAESRHLRLEDSFLPVLIVLVRTANIALIGKRQPILVMTPRERAADTSLLARTISSVLLAAPPHRRGSWMTWILTLRSAQSTTDVPLSCPADSTVPRRTIGY